MPLAIVKPSKVFLWALEKEETRAAGARAAERQYKTALQVYEVHATGLKLLHTFNDQDIKRGQHREEDTWISKIFPVCLAAVCEFSPMHVVFLTPFSSG